MASWTGAKNGRARLDTSRAAGARTIMIVDDDPDIRAALGELLECEGYEVVGAANGAAALALLRSGTAAPCLILLDLMMPYMNGWEFRAEQVRDPALREIPIILLTASGYTNATVRAEFGCVEYFPKPPSPDRLLATIRRIIAPH
jgi:CheY-like chemotaxis protein